MKTYRCDVCGKEVIPKLSYAKGSKMIGPAGESIRGFGSRIRIAENKGRIEFVFANREKGALLECRQAFDLCADCVEELKKFLYNK